MINEFQLYNPIAGYLIVNVDIVDDSGSSVDGIAYMYWIFDPSRELDYYWVQLSDSAGSGTITDFDH